MELEGFAALTTADPPAPDPVGLRQLVGANARRLRTAASTTPDDIARAAGRLGLDWTAAWVTSMERGQKALAAEQLLALPLVLTSALGHRVSLNDLLTGDAPVLLAKAPGPAGAVPAAYLRDMVTAASFHRPFTEVRLPEPVVPAPRTPSAGEQAAEKLRQVNEAHLGNVDIRALKRAEEGAGDAEARLARKLFVQDIVVIAAAASLWGRSLTEERDQALLLEDGSSAARTAVTRRLSAEVADRIADASLQAALARADADPTWRTGTAAEHDSPEDEHYGAFDEEPVGDARFEGTASDGASIPEHGAASFDDSPFGEALSAEAAPATSEPMTQDGSAGVDEPAPRPRRRKRDIVLGRIPRQRRA